MSKKNLILGGILGVLLILAFIYSGPFEKWKNNLDKPDNFLAKIDPASINKIEITGGKKTITIVKADDKWKIDGTKGFYVKKGVMETAVKALDDAKKSELILVSENKDKKHEFSVDDKAGYKVKLKKGDDILAEFVIGKSGSEFGSAYISQDNSNNTYLIKSNLHLAFARDDWYDKTIFSFDADNVNKIRFQYPSREFTVEKTKKKGDKNGQWSGVLPYKFSVNQDKIKDIIDMMSKMTAVDIPAQTFKGTGLEKNNIIVQVSGDGIDDVIMVGDNNGKDQYYVKRGDSDNIYLISKDEKEKLEKRISSLR